MENKLKNCPFCGSKAELKKIKDFDSQRVAAAYVRCSQCCAQQKPYQTENAAIEAWNRRTEENLINKEIIKIKNKNIEDFIKYAQEQFGYNIVLNSNEEPDSFKSIFSGSFLEQDNKETIKIKYFNDNIDKLRYIDGKSDWIDLRASEDIELKKGEFHLIPLGVAMELPKGYEAIIAPRSSAFKNYGIIQTDSIGIIDNSYCGNSDQWMMPVIATRDTTIHMNDRICQFRIIRNQPEIQFNETDILEGKERGGFGSTGI